jgi:antitoxin HicB
MSKTRKTKNPHIGSSFDTFLKEEGIYEDVQATAIKRVLASQLEEAMKTRKLTKVEMARRMRTSRVQLDRLLDPDNDSVTLATLRRAAAVVGREVRLELI